MLWSEEDAAAAAAAAPPAAVISAEPAVPALAVSFPLPPFERVRVSGETAGTPAAPARAVFEFALPLLRTSTAFARCCPTVNAGEGASVEGELSAERLEVGTTEAGAPAEAEPRGCGAPCFCSSSPSSTSPSSMLVDALDSDA